MKKQFATLYLHQKINCRWWFYISIYVRNRRHKHYIKQNTDVSSVNYHNKVLRLLINYNGTFVTLNILWLIRT